MKIRIRYFAHLRDERGRDREELQTDATTPRELYLELRRQHGFRLAVDRLQLAVNDEFCPWDVPLQENDELVFIPPVAGG